MRLYLVWAVEAAVRPPCCGRQPLPKVQEFRAPPLFARGSSVRRARPQSDLAIQIWPFRWSLAM